MEPAQRLMESDLQSPDFVSGAAGGLWGRVDDSRVAWPQQLFWIAVPPRNGAPDRFHFLLDCSGYRAASPTGNLVDAASLERLALDRWPKSHAGSRFAKVFRTDWEERKALYHPFDRFASASHVQWTSQMPHKIWTTDHTMVDYLDEFRSLFHSEDYLGV